MSNQPNTAAETAITQPKVVAGLGFPAGRNEDSPQPTGWLAQSDDISHIDLKAKVSRETF